MHLYPRGLKRVGASGAFEFKHNNTERKFCMGKNKVRTKKTKKFKPLVPFKSVAELENYIINCVNDGKIFIDSRKYHIYVEPCEDNYSKLIITDFLLSAEISRVLSNNFKVVDVDCWVEYEARKDKFYNLFEVLLVNGRLLYSID